MPSQFVDDKAPLCIPFILERLSAHQTESADSDSPRPLLVGLNGLQGVGKTTLVSALAAALDGQGIPTLVCSIDDFYLSHGQQADLARGNAGNALLQHRGEPGTHDVPLLTTFFADLLQGRPTKVPQYDKAAFSGQGDRLPESQWMPVNQPGQPPVQIVIFEGWCVGFRSSTSADIEAKWNAPSRTLQQHRLEHLLFVNDQLRGYDDVTSKLDAFVHIDSEDTQYVYAWRLEQEDNLRIDRGDPTAGMTPDQVTRFVDGYYPAYELYTDGLRNGVLPGRPASQLRLIVGRDRKVKEVIRL